MSTLTVLSLLAALDADNVESVLPIAADALDECGRSDLAEWCRQCEIRHYNDDWWEVFPTRSIHHPLGDAQNYHRNESAARAELLRRVIHHLDGTLHDVRRRRMVL